MSNWPSYERVLELNPTQPEAGSRKAAYLAATR